MCTRQVALRLTKSQREAIGDGYERYVQAEAFLHEDCLALATKLQVRTCLFTYLLTYLLISMLLVHRMHQPELITPRFSQRDDNSVCFCPQNCCCGPFL